MREQLHLAPSRSRRHAIGRRQGGRIPFRRLAAASDDRLVSELRRGDARAFEAIYDRHHRSLLGFCRHMLGSSEEAEDALQHVFVSAHLHLRDGTGRIDLKPWLYTIARNRCLSMLRARRDTYSLESAPEPSTDRLAVAEAVERREDVEELLDDLGRLPDDQRAALLLAEVGDLSQQQIAATLGVRHERVKALIFQARTGLAGWREARATECAEIQRDLATLHGSALRRGPIRRHLMLCEGCADFALAVGRQRAALGAVLPVVPTATLKECVLSAALPAAQGGAASAGAIAAGSAVAASGAAVPGGAGLGAAVSGLAAKALVAGAVIAGAGGAVAVQVKDPPVAQGTAIHAARAGAGAEPAASSGAARSGRLHPAAPAAAAPRLPRSAAPSTAPRGAGAPHAGGAQPAASADAEPSAAADAQHAAAAAATRSHGGEGEQSPGPDAKESPGGGDKESPGGGAEAKKSPSTEAKQSPAKKAPAAATSSPATGAKKPAATAKDSPTADAKNPPAAAKKSPSTSAKTSPAVAKQSPSAAAKNPSAAESAPSSAVEKPAPAATHSPAAAKNAAPTADRAPAADKTSSPPAPQGISAAADEQAATPAEPAAARSGQATAPADDGATTG
jgi:RNA polymerase sigma factor (sigma-70 family)